MSNERVRDAWERHSVWARGAGIEEERVVRYPEEARGEGM